MRNFLTVTLSAAALCLGAAAPSMAASLGLATGDPVITADNATVDFIFGEISVSAATTGGLSDVASLNFSSDGVAGGFSVVGSSSELLAGASLIASGFTDSAIELQFGGLTGEAAAAFGDSALLRVAFSDDLGARDAIFAGLVEGERYDASLSVASVATTAPVPLPAGAILLASGLAGLAFARKRAS